MSSADAEIKDLMKSARISRRAIPVQAGITTAAAATLWLMTLWLSMPLWIPAIILGLLAFTLIGDIINLGVCNRRITKLTLSQNE